MLTCARLPRLCHGIAGLVSRQCRSATSTPRCQASAYLTLVGKAPAGSWSVNTALQDRARSGQPHLVDRQQRKLRRTSIRSRSTTSVAEQPSSALDAAEHHDPLSQAAEKKNAPTFQDAIQKLQNYWASKGCAVLQSSNTEVGAGTMNPATFLRILGPEPWNVAYVEPSIRPDDSRYGDNPNRVQRHTQFQVILKPDPGNSQELYLGSLAALGIDTRAHDIRFVEDNWESPVLGAWGLGWEVWMDGMEVTQFTYMQQAGSLPLAPVPVEITYGLERIIMALQGVDHFKKIRYAPGITYGELFLENEREMSAFNMDHADVDRVRQRFELYDAEARALLEKKLAIPAYDHVLKTSHAFNILDARGAVGVTERQRFFGKMRNLARECSTLWVETRANLGHPLGVVPEPPEPQPEASTSGSTGAEPRMLVLEIGSEELPPQDVVAGIQQLRASVPALLSRLRLSHGPVRVCGTPRRLCVLVPEVAGRQEDKEEELRGPPARAAFKDGKPTKAAEGFCRKNKVAVEDLVVKPDEKGVEYTYATVRQEGRPTAEVLGEELPAVVASLQFPKSMRWSTQAAYSRPLRWLLALHGDAVVPFKYAGAASGRVTRVLRSADVAEQSIASAEEYGASLEQAGLQLDGEKRSESIWAAASSLAEEIGGRIPDSAREELLEEVAYLVEAPSPLLGRFDAAFLTLPREVLVTVMRKHQRYFPVEDAATGQLKPAFVTVANGPVDLDVVRHGNEAVLRARYEDARFFYTSDRSQPLASFRPLLHGITFQAKLGSMLAKSEREEAVLPALAAAAGVEGEPLATAQAAVPMAKADLATAVVTEFTSLAGVIGRHYAEMEGHPQPVCDAVFEAVLPRFAGDQVPHSRAGVLLAVADRLDSLVGLFAVGKGPSASADPFGLRRAAYALVQTLVENNVPLPLPAALRLTAEAQPVLVDNAVLAEVEQFVTRRLEQLLVDGGAAVEVVRAVLAERGHVPARAAQAVREMEALDSVIRERIVAAYARPTRITRTKDVGIDWKVDEQLFETEQEHRLLAAYRQVAATLRPESAVSELFAVSEQLVQPIDDFFSNVFVMAEEEAVRRNRLALLRDIAALPKGILDLSLLPGF